MIDLLFFDELLTAENKQIGWPPGGSFHFKPDVSSLSSWYLLSRDMMWCIRLASSCSAWLLPPNSWQSASTSLASSYYILYNEEKSIKYCQRTTNHEHDDLSSSINERDFQWRAEDFQPHVQLTQVLPTYYVITLVNLTLIISRFN